MSCHSNGENFQPEIVILYCQGCLAKDVDPRDAEQSASGFTVRLAMMPCSSKVEAAHVLKLLEEGADGVQVVGCPEERCRFLVGSTMAEKRIDYARGLLEEIQMGADRLGMVRGSGLSAADLMELAQYRAQVVKPLGANPMKGQRGQ